MPEPGGARLLWCLKCSAGYASLGELPDHCPRCNAEALWSSTAPYNWSVPIKPYLLTVEDKLLLKIFCINPDA